MLAATFARGRLCPAPFRGGVSEERREHRFGKDPCVFWHVPELPPGSKHVFFYLSNVNRSIADDVWETTEDRSQAQAHGIACLAEAV